LGIIGQRRFFLTTGYGTCHCERCGGDRMFRRVRGRGWLALLEVPVVPWRKTPDHLQCTVCSTRYRLGLLELPTLAQMQAVLPAGTQAAAVAMLRAGDPRSGSARRQALAVIQAAGLASYDDHALDADLDGQIRPSPEFAGLLERLAGQLVDQARAWFLADMVRIGLADGPLTSGQRRAAERIGTHMGLNDARARAVIELTEHRARLD
jgi:hypothetical protein